MGERRVEDAVSEDHSSGMPTPIRVRGGPGVQGPADSGYLKARAVVLGEKIGNLSSHAEEAKEHPSPGELGASDPRRLTFNSATSGAGVAL